MSNVISKPHLPPRAVTMSGAYKHNSRSPSPLSKTKKDEKYQAWCFSSCKWIYFKHSMLQQNIQVVFELLVSCVWLLLFVPFVFVHCCDNTWVQISIDWWQCFCTVILVGFFAISLLILISPLLSRLWVMICPCEDQPASSPPIVPHPSQGRAPRSKYFELFGQSF